MNNTNIESAIIRAVWVAVHTINKNTLLQLSDRDLTNRIVKQVESMSLLTSADRQSLMDYIRAKVVLIREISDS